jgi:hypothetical protein
VTHWREKQAFTVRVEASVYLALLERARNNKRTLGAEIEVILEGLVLPSVPPAVALVEQVPDLLPSPDAWFL